MKEVALMYSGGLDTTYSVLKLLERYDRLHLLTFCNGVCVRVNASKDHVALLEKKFGKERFVHHVVGVKDVFHALRGNIWKEIARQRSPLMYDLCCRLSMETATIVYCLEHGITTVADGNNPQTQGTMFLQEEEYLQAAGRFFGGYGIEYIRPDWFLSSRKDILDTLEKNGIRTAVRFLEKIGITSQLFTQPFCLWAPITFFFTSPLRHNPLSRRLRISTARAIELRKAKEERAKDLIYSYQMYHHAVTSGYPECRQKLPGIFSFIKKGSDCCGQ